MMLMLLPGLERSSVQSGTACEEEGACGALESDELCSWRRHSFEQVWKSCRWRMECGLRLPFEEAVKLWRQS